MTASATGRLVEAYLLGQAALEARYQIITVILPVLPCVGLDGPLDADQAARLDAIVRESVLRLPISRVALRGRTGQLLYEISPTRLVPGGAFIAP